MAEGVTFIAVGSDEEGSVGTWIKQEAITVKMGASRLEGGSKKS